MKLSQKDIEDLDLEMGDGSEDAPLSNIKTADEAPSEELADTEATSPEEYESHEHNDEDEAEYNFDFFETYRETRDELAEEFEEFTKIDDYVPEPVHIEIDEDSFRGKGRNVNALPRTKALLTDGEYISQRLENQMNWFDRKSSIYQRKYKKFKHWEFIIAAFIPVVVTFSAMGFVEKTILYQGGDVLINLSIVFQMMASLGGVLLIIFNKNLELEEYFKLWKDYRSNAEALQFERMRYLTRTEPYDEEDAYPRLVERVEHLLNRENLKWQQQEPDAKNKKKDDE